MMSLAVIAASKLPVNVSIILLPFGITSIMQKGLKPLNGGKIAFFVPFHGEKACDFGEKQALNSTY